MLGLPDDARDYGIAASILKDLKVSSVLLMTNNPKKIESLNKEGIAVSNRIPLVAEISEDTYGYMRTKQKNMGHLIDF